MKTPAPNFSTLSPLLKRLFITTIFASLTLSCPVPAHELEFRQVENLTASGMAHLIPNSPASKGRVYSGKKAIADIDLTIVTITALKPRKIFELYEPEIVVDFCLQDLARKNRGELVLALEGLRRWP